MTNTDTLSPLERSQRMRLVKSKDTKPEMQVRRIVHAMGYRYRLHAKTLPGKPDIVFRRMKKAIFVHGCFWHAHPSSKCKLARLPKSKLDYWKTKLEKNKNRDLIHQRTLRALGWSTMIVWECELKNAEKVQERLQKFLSRG